MKSKAKAEHVTPLQWSWCCFPWLPVSPAIPWFSKVFLCSTPMLGMAKEYQTRIQMRFAKIPRKNGCMAHAMWSQSIASIENIEFVPHHFRVFRQIAAWPARQALPFQSNKNLVQICSNQQINANNSKQHSQFRLMWIQNAKPRTLSSPIQQEHFDFSNLLWRVQSDDYSSGTCPESHSLSSQKIRPNLMH